MRILICDDEVRYINDLQGYIEEYINQMSKGLTEYSNKIENK